MCRMARHRYQRPTWRAMRQGQNATITLLPHPQRRMSGQRSIMLQADADAALAAIISRALSYDPHGEAGHYTWYALRDDLALVKKLALRFFREVWVWYENGELMRDMRRHIVHRQLVIQGVGGTSING